MMSEAELLREAERTGFQAESLERVFNLFEILESLHSHPYLRQRIALKGGTALNLFFLPLPRLSVDIDFNYIGSDQRETMLAEKPKVEQAVEAVCSRLGIQIRRAPTEHAGGKWQLSYRSVSGLAKSLSIDMNFLLRSPLWPPVLMNSLQISSYKAETVPVLDIHELAAGKLSALFSRNASRDLFDVNNMFRYGNMDLERLRLGFVVYGGAARRDWRTITLEDIKANANDIANQLIPMLQRELVPSKGQIKEWNRKLVQECREYLAQLLPLRPHEVEFISGLNDRGEIFPDLLTEDKIMQSILLTHPALQWKALNVREYKKS